MTEALTPAVATRRAERTLIPAVFVTQLGNNVQLIGASFLVFKATGTALSVGWVLVAVSMPQALLSWLFGRLADRFDRRTLCVISDVGSALAALVLPVWLILGHQPSGPAYVASFMLAAGAALFLPASNALIKERIEPDRLSHFSSRYEIASQAGMLISGVVGGLAIESFGVRPMFLFNAVTFLGSACLISRLGRVPVAPAADADGAEPQAGGDRPEAIPSGPRPVARLVGLFVASSAMITVVNTILLVLVIDHFDQGPVMFGLVEALGGVGILLGAAHYDRLVGRDYRQLVLLGLGGCAVTELLMPLSLVTLLPLIVVAGYSFGIGRIAVRAELLRVVDQQKVGRVFGAAYGFGLVAAVIATVAIASLTDRTSPITGFVTLGLCAGIAILTICTSLWREPGTVGVSATVDVVGAVS